MQCEVCNRQEAGGVCGECGTKVCTQCGRKCAACGKILCPPHMKKTDSGRILCGPCMVTRNDRRAEALAQQKTVVLQKSKPVAAPPPEPARGGLSFQDLQAELGDGPVFTGGVPGAGGGATSEGLINPDTGLEEGYDPEVDAKLAALLGEDGNVRMEALGASASRGTPIWLSGLFAGGVSCILCLLVLGGSGFAMMQPYTSYSILLLSVGTMIWSGYGFFHTDDSPRERKLCLLPFALGLIASIIAYIRMNPTPPPLPF